MTSRRLHFGETFRASGSSEFNGDAIIKPARKIRDNDIIRDWDDCRRIFVSLARKETAQQKLAAFMKRGPA